MLNLYYIQIGENICENLTNSVKTCIQTASATVTCFESKNNRLIFDNFNFICIFLEITCFKLMKFII
jgi:hypothetical protein